MPRENERIISIAPAFNEETRIGDFLKRFDNAKNKIVDTVLIVNDGSSDKTAEISKSYNATVVSHEKRRGLGAALKTGIRYALDQGYTIIVILAPNGKDNPLEIPNVYRPVVEGKADYVQGSRYIDTNYLGKMPFIRRFATKLHPFLVRLVTGFPATDSTNGFRAIRAKVFTDNKIDIWQDWLDTVSFEFYLYLMVLKHKYRVAEVPVTKVYPKTMHPFNYSKSGAMTKTLPIRDWWRILKPLFYYTIGKI